MGPIKAREQAFTMDKATKVNPKKKRTLFLALRELLKFASKNKPSFSATLSLEIEESTLHLQAWQSNGETFVSLDLIKPGESNTLYLGKTTGKGLLQAISRLQQSVLQ